MTASPSAPDLGFVHRYEPGDSPPLLLLHGTGGDENDLVPLAQAVAPGAALLSPRGQVLENGHARFFRRFGEGRFDLEDVAARADGLARFIAAARAQYGIAAPVALGFSNGANIAAAMMLRHPEALSGAALIRAQPTIGDEAGVDLHGVPVLILSGAMDPIIPAAEAERLADMLRAAGARPRHETLPAGHGLTQQDLSLLKDWRDGLAA